MQAHRKLLWLGTVLAVAAASLVAGLGAAVAAPGVSPATFSASAGPGSTFTVAKTVTTPEIAPLADVYFLADTTGSMSDPIANVKANASTILSTIVGPGRPTRSSAPATTRTSRSTRTRSRTRRRSARPPPTCRRPSTAGAPAAGATAPRASCTRCTRSRPTRPSAGGPARRGSSCGSATRPATTRSAPPCGAAAFDITTVPRGERAGRGEDHRDRDQHAHGLPAGAERQRGRWASTTSRSAARPATSTNQANIITAATGGTHLSAASSSDVANLILSALQDLPVTVTSTSTCDPGLSVGMSPASQSGTSGDVFDFTETVSVDGGASAGPHALHRPVPAQRRRGAGVHAAGDDRRPRRRGLRRGERRRQALDEPRLQIHLLQGQVRARRGEADRRDLLQRPEGQGAQDQVRLDLDRHAVDLRQRGDPDRKRPRERRARQLQGGRHRRPSRHLLDRALRRLQRLGERRQREGGSTSRRASATARAPVDGGPASAGPLPFSRGRGRSARAGSAPCRRPRRA